MKRITTTISDEMYDLAKKGNIKWHDALAKGIKQAQIPHEINELRLGNDKLQRKLTEFGSKLYHLERRVETLEDEVKILKLMQNR